MTGPIPLLILLLLAGALAYLLNRWRTVAFGLAIGTSLVLGLVLLLIPYGEPIPVFGHEVVLLGTTSLLGRELSLGPAGQAAMTFLLLTSALLFTIAWRLEQGTLLAPIGLATLGLLGGMLVIRPLIYAALLLQISIPLIAFAIQADPRLPVRGGLRYLTFLTLALPGLLISHWLLDMYAITPDRTELLAEAAVLIGVSFALLLGLVPFHPWVPAVGRDGASLSTAFLFSVLGGAIWFLLLEYLRIYPWLATSPPWASTLFLLGTITAVVGGLLATTDRGPGALMGYMMMVDTGLMVVGLAHGRVALGIGMVLVRPFGAALMAAGLCSLRERGGIPGSLPLGLGKKAAWSTIALIVGGLSLAGFPPTVGFAPRWGLFRLLFQARPMIALTLLLATAGPVVGLLRLLTRLLTPPPPRPPRPGEEEAPPPEPSPAPREPVLLILVLLLAVLGMGAFPQWLMRAAYHIGSLFIP